ncbi:MAG: hypothetical protein ACYDEX_03720, partial [Mobilitalea sp.]
GRYTKTEALKMVLPRIARLLVFFEEEQLKSFYRLPLKLIKEAVAELEKDGTLSAVVLEGKNGYILSEDKDLLQVEMLTIIQPKVLLLQRNDFLVRAHADYLKERYTSEWDALYYLLIDGVFHGVVVGRFKFGPHLIEDIVLDLPEDETIRRRDEILEAVYKVFDQVNSPAKRYKGKTIIYEL